MSTTSVLSTVRRQSALVARLADYLELTKPRIVVLELIVAGAAACLATPYAVDAAVVLSALWGTALVAASASMANQWWERGTDVHMSRTAGRPLPDGRVSSFEVLGLSALTLVVGAGWLVWRVNPLTAALGVACWFIYVAIYTPLKTRTPLNTAVGAVAGAMPVLMGWTATGTPLNLEAWALAGVLFLWQFPHFMAIAWLYRRDYVAVGHRMLPVVDPTGLRCSVQAVVGALLAIPVSLIPATSAAGGSPLAYFAWAVGLGAAQLALAVRFALVRDEHSARLLLRGTLLYLPAWLGMLLLVTM